MSYTKIIELKSDPEVFQLQWDGFKPWEYRIDDGRNFEVGDTLVLREHLVESDTYTGRSIAAKVTYLLKGKYCLPENHVVMSINEIGRIDENDGLGTQYIDATDHADQFVRFFDEMQFQIHEVAISKGWWEVGKARNSAEVLLLIIEEVLETHRALRHHNPPSDKILGFSQAEEETADAIIRYLDLAEARGWRIAAAILAKNGYNKTRPYRHGGLAA